MRTYFADTWYLIALQDRLDNHHLQARSLHVRLHSCDLVTHEGVLTEMLAYFSDAGAAARLKAASVARDLLRSIEVVAPDRALFVRSVDRYAARLDKEYSLVDCMSMIVMEERGIRHVLTNDHHFTQAGFTVVNQ